MIRLAKKLTIVLIIPLLIYFSVFIYFEPYNYFGIKKSDYTGDSAIVRIRNFNAAPKNAIILGDSRMAHFDMKAVEEYAQKPFSQLSFGGAAFNESMDIFYYAIDENPDIDTVYFGVSFYTLNESYYKDRMSQIQRIATNPFAYLFNFNYTIEMLNEIKYFFKGEKNVAEKNEKIWPSEDYIYPDGAKRKYRKNLEAFATQIYAVCSQPQYSLDEEDIDRYIELAKYCKDNSIKLYTVLPPLDDSLKELVVDKLSIGDDIMYFIDKVSPHSEVLNYEYNEENPFMQDEFYDGFHLDMARGLPRFTQMLFER